MPAEYRTISARVPAEEAEAFAEQARRLRLTTSRAIAQLVRGALDAEREAAASQAEGIPWAIGRST
jgi:hypothetical protein